jgi:hypothetical protein
VREICMRMRIKNEDHVWVEKRVGKGVNAY